MAQNEGVCINNCMITFYEYMNINEVQSKMMQYMQSLVPKWPPYVVSDLLYKGFSPSQKRSTNNPRELAVFLQEMAQSYGYATPQQMQWKLQELTITKDIFDDETLRRMQERGMGQSNPYGVPDDAQRHQGAAARMQQNPNVRVRGYSGASGGEPILLVRWRSGKHELLEGWHRTIQMLLNFPEGYQQQAYLLQAVK